MLTGRALLWRGRTRQCSSFSAMLDQGGGGREPVGPVSREVRQLEDTWSAALTVIKREEGEEGAAVRGVGRAGGPGTELQQGGAGAALGLVVPPTLQLASLVQGSPTLQRLLDLGVDLHHWQRMGELGLAAKLHSFDQNVKPTLQFLLDCGVEAGAVGRVLSRAPGLLEEEVAVLASRVQYLTSKQFTQTEVGHILTAAPTWLLFSVRSIDARLGFFQKSLELSGPEVRKMAVAAPSLVTWGGTPTKVKEIMFSFNEEMGFSQTEVRQMVMDWPLLLRRQGSTELVKTFQLLHTEAGIPHSLLAAQPRCLTVSVLAVRARLAFLRCVKRYQFCPAQPGFISPALLACSSDPEFCQALGLPEELFDKFQRTL